MTTALTPVERRGDFWFKRDDLFEIAGVRGGKVRTCWHLAQGEKGLVTAGSRSSPQINIVAHIAKELGVPCRAHAPTGKLSPELEDAQSVGAEIVQHKVGYNSVIVARAREDARKLGWTNIPFSMECQEAVDATSEQVENIPPGIRRIVVPVGSGMSLSGIVAGLGRFHRRIKILGVCVGATPTKRLNTFCPQFPGHPVGEVELTYSSLHYHEHAPKRDQNILGINLDPIYEAKCVEFLRPDDLFWIVGIRKTAISVYKDA